jgi:hypothetical protein
MDLTTVQQRAFPPVLADRPRYRATYRQHLVTVGLSTWLMVGLFVDGWAHNHLDASLETFFTPWHAVFYSGFTASALWLLWLVRLGLRRGLAGAAAVPQGYGLGLVGLAVFAVGGVGDMTWHLVFGIERDVEALFSPTHLVLFVGAALLLGSPFRDAWAAHDREDPPLRAFAPALASLTLLVSLLQFFFMYWSPFTTWWPTSEAAGFAAGAGDYAYAVREFAVKDGVASVVVTTVLLVGPLLLMLRRWRLPFGAATVLFTVPAVLSSAIDAFDRPAVLLAAPAGGLATDVLLRWLMPTVDRRATVCAVAAAGPIVLFATWFAALALTRGVWYTTPVWSGMIVWAGLTGLGVALVVLPAPVPATVRARVPVARAGP